MICVSLWDTGLAQPHSNTAELAPLCGRGWQHQMEISKRGGMTPSAADHSFSAECCCSLRFKSLHLFLRVVDVSNERFPIKKKFKKSSCKFSHSHQLNSSFVNAVRFVQSFNKFKYLCVPHINYKILDEISGGERTCL